MLSNLRWRIALGGGLILLGIFSLLDSLGILPGGSIIWGLFFGVLSGVFLYLLLSNRQQFWWAAIPGFTLLGIAAAIIFEGLFPRLSGDFGGFLVVGSIGLAFVVVYLVQRAFWWAIIPAGVMLSVAMMILIDQFVRVDVGWLVLLGISATFGVVSLMQVQGRRMSWALWPAGVLLVIALLAAVESLNLAGYIFPLLMILGGGLLVWRAIRGRGPVSPSSL